MLSRYLRKSVKQQHFSKRAISDVKVNQLISKIKLSAMPATARPGIEVKANKRDCSDLAEFDSTGKADNIDSPRSKDEIIAKYRSQVEFYWTVSENRAEKLLNLLRTLKDLDNVEPLVDLAIKKYETTVC
jgi:hypothetical protein